MAFTKAYAKILAGMMSDETLEAFRMVCGKKDHVGEVSEQTLKELESLELVRRDKDLLDGKQLVLLTSRGKKVAEFV